MKRRTLLKTAVTVPVVLASGAVGVAAVAQGKEYDLSSLFEELQALDGQHLRSGTTWSVSEVFQHCAQSIRGSMDGYPQHYSAAFKLTAGRVAFTVFRASGTMRHNLTEGLPGLPAADAAVEQHAALHRLLAALQDFSAYQGPLAPHFAYGELDKPAYTAAHWLHIRNHLQQIFPA